MSKFLGHRLPATYNIPYFKILDGRFEVGYYSHKHGMRVAVGYVHRVDIEVKATLIFMDFTKVVIIRPTGHDSRQHAGLTEHKWAFNDNVTVARLVKIENK